MIALVFDKSVDAIVILPVPSNDCPAIVLAFAKAVAVSALPVTLPVTFPSKFATSVPVVIVKSPVEAPVNVPVPTINLSVLSSQPIKALLLSPLSMTIPMSLPGVPVVPVPNSISLSSIVELVVESVVVVPFTVKFPVTTALPPTVNAPLSETAPASEASIVNAVTAEPPSFTINEISLSCPVFLICAEPELFINFKYSVEPSCNIISAPSAFKIISPAASTVKSPVASISAITGVVSVLLVNVCEAVNNAIAAVLDKSVLAIVILPVPSKLCPAIVLAVARAVAVSALPVTSPVILPVNVPAIAPVPVIVGDVKVLLVKVCEPVNVATVESIAIEILLLETVVSTPVPPANVSVSVPTTTPSFEPLSAAIVNVVDIASTYALIDCCVAS